MNDSKKVALTLQIGRRTLEQRFRSPVSHAWTSDRTGLRRHSGVRPTPSRELDVTFLE